MSSIKNNVISFDMDNTLAHPFGGEGINPYIKETRDFVLRLMRRGYEVWIITRRYGPEKSSAGIGMEHQIVWDVADELGIPRERVIFTNRAWKYPFVERIGACMHIDDDEKEKELIEKYLPEVKMIWLGHDNWDEILISKIEEHDFLKIWFSNDENNYKFGILIFIILLFIILFS